MSAEKIETLAILGAGLAIAGVIYYASRKVYTAASDAAQAAGSKVADAAEYFAPLVNPESLVTYFIQFPDGATHAINGDQIDASGFFYYHNSRFQVGMVGNKRVAVAA